MAAPTLQQLTYFVAAVDHGSVVAAAEATHVAQPSLSEQVHGTGLADNTAADLVSDGLDEDSIRSLVYDPTAANFDSEISQMVDFNPDAILVIGFEETSRIIEGLNAQGIGPQR